MFLSRYPVVAGFLPAIYRLLLASLFAGPSLNAAEAPALPVILTEPRPASVGLGERLVLEVVAGGSAPLGFQWWHNQAPLADATNATLTIASASLSDAGTYAVLVTNRYGTARSQEVQVNVRARPRFRSEPSGRLVPVGETLHLDAVAEGSSPIAYHWLHYGKPAVQGFAFNGGTAFEIGQVRSSDAGFYSVIASNRWGTVTSRLAQVTIGVGTPNRDFAGHRFVRLAATGDRVEGTGATLGGTVAATGARWTARHLLFPATDTEGQAIGIVGAGLAGTQLILPVGERLPNQLGIAGEYAFPVVAAASDPLLVMASAQGRPGEGALGIYRVGDAGLESLVDATMTAPDSGGKKFIRFTEAVQHGERLAFLAMTADRTGLYLWENGSVRRWIDTTMDLPEVGTFASHLYGLGWDGEVAALAVWNANVGFLAGLRLDGRTGVQALIAVGDPLPDSGIPLQSMTRFVVDQETVYGSAAGGTLLEWKGDQARTRLGYGTLVDEWGPVAAVEEKNFQVVAGEVFAAVGPNPAFFPIHSSKDGRQRLLSGRLVDGQAVLNPSLPLAVDQTRVALQIRPTAGQTAVYANLRPVLVWERTVSGALSLHVPQGMRLEKSLSASGPWAEVESPGDGAWETSGAQAYFRLRE